jgi:hypothetical protein
MKRWMHIVALSAALASFVAPFAMAQDATPTGMVRFAEVAATGGRGARQEAITLFHVSASGIIWARRAAFNISSPQWASSETCPALLDAAQALHEVTRPELVFPFTTGRPDGEEVVVTADGPTVTLWVQGLLSGQHSLTPGEIQIRGDAISPHAQWLSHTSQRLSDCWSNQAPE